MILHFRARELAASHRISYLCRRRWQECNENGKWFFLRLHNTTDARFTTVLQRARNSIRWEFAVMRFSSFSFLACQNEFQSLVGLRHLSLFFGQTFECETCCSLFAHHVAVSIPANTNTDKKRNKKVNIFSTTQTTKWQITGYECLPFVSRHVTKKSFFRSENVAPASEP